MKARVLLAAALALCACGAAFGVAVSQLWLLVIAVPFALVGALIAERKPENPIGWLYLAFGVVASLTLATYGYAWRGLVGDPGSLPAANFFASLSVHIWHPSFGLLVFSFLLFPRGRLLSPRWRWFAWLTAFTYGGLALSGLFEREYLEGEFNDLRAHALFGGTIADVASLVFGVLLLVNLALLAVAGASLVVRLRRSTGEERQQVKWFVYAVSFVLFFFPLSILTFDEAYGVYLFPLIPIAAAVAILRHRLYDIDVVIKRTLVYGTLTAVLGGAYIGSVLVLQLLLSPTSDLAIAGSTLAVAALFRPALTRIQALVNRRFYRNAYDAQRTVEDFTARLRDEVSLDTLTDELRGVVEDTVHPAHVSVWLR